jgi:hypothetical protein
MVIYASDYLSRYGIGIAKNICRASSMRIRMVKQGLLLPRLSWHGIECELLKNTPFFHVFIVLFYGLNMKVNSPTMTYNQSESRNVYAFKEKLIKETS